MLEAEENVDSFHDDDEFELDTPKRKNKNRGKVSGRLKNETQHWLNYCWKMCVVVQFTYTREKGLKVIIIWGF